VSCRHDLANGTCRRCYPSTGALDPGPEEVYEDNLEGIGAVTKEEYMGMPTNVLRSKEELTVISRKAREVIIEGEKQDAERDAERTNMKDQKVGTHYLKSHPLYFMLVKMDKKSFEIRKNDRDFRVGDKIVLCEWDPSLARDRPSEGYTGSTRTGEIVSMVPSGNGISGCADEAIVPGFVVLGMEWE
jgi:hypothetical protein